MNTLTTTVMAHAFFWALLHSLWQGLVIYAAAFAVHKALPGIPRARYYVSASAFAGIFAWFVYTLVAQYQRLAAEAVHSALMGSVGAVHSFNTVVYAGNDALQHYSLHLERYMPLAMWLYVAGLVFMLVRFTLGYSRVQSLRTEGIIFPDAHLNELLLKCKRQLMVKRPVHVLLSHMVKVPVMIGAIKPIILLPVAAASFLSAEQLEAILMHELAHIRRNDYLVNLLQSVGEAILFFNPFIWLISAALKKDRELCCDDLVVGSVADRLPYAQALTILEERRTHAFAMAATGSKNQLFHRIKRIMEMKKKDLNYGQLAIIAIAVIAIICITVTCTVTPSMAQKATKDSGDTTHQKATYKYKSVIIDGDGNRTEKEEVSDKPIAHDEDGNTSSSESSISSSASAAGGHVVTVQNSVVNYSDDDTDKGSADMKRLMEDITILTKDVSKEVADAMVKAQKQMNAIDWDAISKQVNDAMEEVDKEMNDPKIRAEIKDDVRKGMDEGKKGMEQARKEIAKAMKEVNEEMAKQHKETAKDDNDKGPGNQFDAMLQRMQEDGLIDRNGTFKIKKDDDKLYINDELQPAEVYNRYKKYLPYRSAAIKGKKGDMHISIND